MGVPSTVAAVPTVPTVSIAPVLATYSLNFRFLQFSELVLDLGQLLGSVGLHHLQVRAASELQGGVPAIREGAAKTTSVIAPAGTEKAERGLLGGGRRISCERLL